MKRLLSLLFVSILAVSVNATYYHKTLKLGEVFYRSNAFVESLPSECAGDAIAVEFEYGQSVKIYAIKPGIGTYQYFHSKSEQNTFVFHVLDVIPTEVEIIVGGSYTYSPVAEMGDNIYAIKDFTWHSSNESVAKVDANGHVTTIAPGKAIISATANYKTSYTGTGYTAKSVVTVSTQQVQEVTLNKTSYEMSVGGTYSLTATVAPTNATQKKVNWFSSNENVAQVSDAGKVTAIGPGYCSIYAKADDGSGKFAKCLIHVTGTAGSRSDVNGDGEVTVTDAEVVIDEILSQP